MSDVRKNANFISLETTPGPDSGRCVVKMFK